MQRATQRRLLGMVSLAACICLGSTISGAGPLPAETYSKVVEADISHLEQLVELAKTKKGIPGRVKATAMLIATYAQDNISGKDADLMAALRAAALKVAESASKKNIDAAAIAALKSVKPDANANKQPMKLHSLHKLDLHEVMDLFAASTGGGMNIEKDIREMKKSGVRDVKDAEIIAARTMAIADLALELTPEFSAKRKKEDWDRLMKEMKSIATDLGVEAAKGNKADPVKLKKTITALDANCVNCHGIFRDDP